MFAEVAIGFLVAAQYVNETAETIVVEVSVLSGTLQRSVDVSFNTVESTLGNAATGKFTKKRLVLHKFLLVC